MSERADVCQPAPQSMPDDQALGLRAAATSSGCMESMLFLSTSHSRSFRRMDNADSSGVSAAWMMSFRAWGGWCGAGV